MSTLRPPPLDEDDAQVACHFLRTAPTLVGADDLGVASAPVKPWPHQLRTVRRAVERFPQGFLFCDEVGLGKTVEALLALRQLLLAGRVKRALILVPKALLRQWQEELHEKAALDVPRFDGGRFLGLDDAEPPAADPDAALPWDRYPLILASSQAVRRASRRDELLRAKNWDLLILDEAHHARRGSGGRPNRLLELLRGSATSGGGHVPGLRERCRCCYLLTATPMQVDAVEIWDLLGLLGLGGAWGAREQDFLRYFEQLRLPWPARDLPFLLRMAADALANAVLFPDAEAQLDRVEGRLPPVARAFLRAARTGEPFQPPGILDDAERMALDPLLRALTPLRFLLWRTTRKALRAYHAQGLIATPLPERYPENVWIDLRPAETVLYQRIDAYLAEHYQRFEARRPGLGFLMTIYRRRLTSSFAAIQRSLERRRAFVLGRLPAESLLDGLDDEEDVEDESADVPRDDARMRADARAEELAELEALLVALGRTHADVKLERLLADLAELLPAFGRVLVFTQYADTLDAIRDHLLAAGLRIGCYSGRGGEGFREQAWRPWPKEDLKEAFARGELDVLLCTDAASEGLNLQTCGALINFDMPWNPMRVEQRIGRIDRLGQVHPRIVVRNYFYSDTVEAEIYRRLSLRIAIFQDVVGPLQPILHRVGLSVRRLAMLPAAERGAGLEQDLAAIDGELGQSDSAPDLLEADPWLDSPEEDLRLRTPIVMPDVEAILRGAPTIGALLRPEPDVEGGLLLRWGGRELRVTASPELYARWPYRYELLTWGRPLFHALLAQVPAPVGHGEPGGIGLYAGARPAPVALFVGPEGPLDDWSAFRRALADRARPWPARQESEASTLFSRARLSVLRGMVRVEEGRRRAELRALQGAARRVLVHWALLALKEAEDPGLFAEPLPYGFGVEVVAGLDLQGEPWSTLLAIVRTAGDLPAALSHDPYYLDLAGRSPGARQRRRRALATQASDLRRRWLALQEAETEAKLLRSDRGIELRRTFFRSVAASAGLPLPMVDPPIPFEDAVPLYDDLEEAVRRFVACLGESLPPQGEEIAAPERFTWVALEGRRRPAPGLFVAPLPEGGHGLFRLDRHRPARHQRALVYQSGSGLMLLADPTTLGRAESEGDDLVVVAHLLAVV
jgi:superfamily II DNA or RNA helicase